MKQCYDCVYFGKMVTDKKRIDYELKIHIQYYCKITDLRLSLDSKSCKRFKKGGYMAGNPIKKYVENVNLYNKIDIDKLIVFLKSLKDKGVYNICISNEINFGAIDIEFIESCIYPGDTLNIEFNFKY